MTPLKVEKLFWFCLAKVIGLARPRLGTLVQYYYLRRWGVNFSGRPNFIASSAWFDGTNYSLISLGEQVTLSADIKILTHDWAMHTVAKAFGVFSEKPLGRIERVSVGDFSFVGMGCILMPGSEIGRGCIIAAGSTVRGKIPDFSIYAGSPGHVIGDVREYLNRKIANFDKSIEP